ncbi:MAG: hypothetical protein WBB07_13970 [Mycobacterium sp.]
MSRWTGLTWDHPRGYEALRAAVLATAAPDCDLTWDIQPLEGFEAAPIGVTAQRYDLIVLDHPHVGEALAQNALRPVDDLFGPDEIASWDLDSAGPSMRSYRMDGRLWALPLDAATQVAVVADTSVAIPQTWSAAVELAHHVESRVPTSGPHPFLTLCSIAIADGAQPGQGPTFLSAAAVGAAVETLRHFIPADCPRDVVDNPITLLDAMAAGTGPVYCPHVYGYVNYARSAPALTFGDAPLGSSGRRGAVLGGTGIAFSALREEPDSALLDHVRWLMNPDVQRGFLVDHAGQPGSATAWRDAAVDNASNGFFSGTRVTLDESWIRPRGNGAIAFQQHAADEVRRCLFDHQDTDRLARELDRLHADYLSGIR